MVARKVTSNLQRIAIGIGIGIAIGIARVVGRKSRVNHLLLRPPSGRNDECKSPALLFANRFRFR